MQATSAMALEASSVQSIAKWGTVYPAPHSAEVDVSGDKAAQQNLPRATRSFDDLNCRNTLELMPAYSHCVTGQRFQLSVYFMVTMLADFGDVTDKQLQVADYSKTGPLDPSVFASTRCDNIAEIHPSCPIFQSIAH